MPPPLPPPLQRPVETKIEELKNKENDCVESRDFLFCLGTTFRVTSLDFAGGENVEKFALGAPTVFAAEIRSFNPSILQS
jgi:hypothetical protein